jgi:CheY-like chemotaxis protein
MLGELGYRVIEARTADEALKLAESEPELDLLVTDYLMPGTNGADLARAVRMRRPDLPVLIISGYADADGIAPDLPRLTKPFRQDELSAKIGTLSRRAQGAFSGEAMLRPTGGD